MRAGQSLFPRARPSQPPHSHPSTAFVFTARRAGRYFLLHGGMLNYYEEPPFGPARGRSKGDPIVSRVAHVRPSEVAELSADRGAAHLHKHPATPC